MRSTACVHDVSASFGVGSAATLREELTWRILPKTPASNVVREDRRLRTRGAGALQAYVRRRLNRIRDEIARLR